MNCKTCRYAPFLAALLMVTISSEQAAMAVEIQASAPAQGSAAPASQTITVPAGTVVPLTLVSPINSKATKVGDAVRAVVAFPITEGDQVAIPAGTYVEGTITSLTSQAKAHQQGVQIHFTRLLYANGYAAMLDAANTQAALEIPGTSSPVVADNNDAVGRGAPFPGSAAFQSTPTFPTLPPLTPLPPENVGPPKGPIIGGILGGFTALVVAGILLARRNNTSNADYVLLDAGWQFQMTLQSPLEVDAGRVTAAAATGSH